MKRKQREVTSGSKTTSFHLIGTTPFWPTVGAKTVLFHLSETMHFGQAWLPDCRRQNAPFHLSETASFWRLQLVQNSIVPISEMASFCKRFRRLELKGDSKNWSDRRIFLSFLSPYFVVFVINLMVWSWYCFNRTKIFFIKNIYNYNYEIIR